jgi:hypothetical protein
LSLKDTSVIQRREKCPTEAVKQSLDKLHVECHQEEMLIEKHLRNGIVFSRQARKRNLL